MKSDLAAEEQLTILNSFVEFTKSFRDYDIFTVLLVPVLCCFYRYVSDICEKNWRNLIPASLFSLFMILGGSYEKTGGWDLIFNINNLQWLKTLIRFSGYAVFFYYCINLIFHKVDVGSTDSSSVLRKNRMWSWYIEGIKNRPFVTAFVTLCVCYIPYAIVSYPAISSWDMRIQIMQSYPEVGIYAPAYTETLALREGVYLNNHHPIVHTLLMHLCLEIGNTFLHSYSRGLFLMALLQTLVMFCAVALLVSLLIEINVSENKVCVVLLYYVVSPRIQNYMFLMSKDVIFSAFFLMFLVELFYIGKKNKIRHYVLFGVSVLGVFLFRNDGRYLLILSFVIIGLLMKNLRRTMSAFAVILILLSVVWSNVLLPMWGIIPGSVRELLSIPFQQTARYVRDSGTPLTQEEEEVISAVLDFETVVEKYDPELSDNIKSTFKDDASKEDLRKYFVIYVKMFLKHPSHYIQATLNNYYYYFYPGSRLSNYYSYHYSTANFSTLNDQMEKYDIYLHLEYPEILSAWRDTYEKLREGVARLPIISVLVSAASYNWVLLLMLFYCIQHGRKKGLVLIVPLCLQLLISLAGPANGWYFRYTYPIAICLPAALLLCLRMPEEDGTEHYRKQFSIAGGNI